MPAQSSPIYGLSNLYLFPVFQTREAYKKATGQEAPPYDPTKRLKSWFDPKALESPRRKIIYDNVLAANEHGLPISDANGKPMLEPLVIDREEAAAVNIPYKAPGVPDQPYTGPEWPVPLRPLEPNEELFFQFGNVVAVKNTETYPDLEGFGPKDRALLLAIARKLGV